MSTMVKMDMLVMSKAGDWSAKSTEHAAVKRETHRRYAIELKRRIVEETFAPGASVSIVARRHDVNANMVFTWRQKYYRGSSVRVSQQMFSHRQISSRWESFTLFQL